MGSVPPPPQPPLKQKLQINNKGLMKKLTEKMIRVYHVKRSRLAFQFPHICGGKLIESSTAPLIKMKNRKQWVHVLSLVSGNNYNG